MGLLSADSNATKRGSITVILDSCYSGTGTRSSGLARLAPKDIRFGPTPPPPETFGDPVPSREPSIGSDPDMPWITIAGSQADQRSYEVLKDSRDNGALTYYFVQEMRKPSPVRRSYKEIRDRVQPAVQGEYPNQRPQFEANDLDRIVFEDASVGPRNYVPALSSGAKEVIVKGGRIHGFTANSEFDIYSPQSQMLEPPDLPIARVTLRDVNELTSMATVVTGKQVPEGSKAIERLHSYAAQRTRLLFDGIERSATLQRIKAQVLGHPNRPFEVVGLGQPFQIRLAEENSSIRTFGPDGIELSAGVSLTDRSPVDAVEKRLLGWARWLSLFALRNPASSLRVGFELQPTSGSDVLAAGQIPAFAPGPDRYKVTIKNLTSHKLYVYIVDFTSRGRVRVIYPPSNSTEPLEAGQVRPIVGGASLPDAQTNYVRDVYKLIATTAPVDLTFLEQDTPKGSDVKKASKPPADRLNRLLFEAALGRRDGTVNVPTEWVTADQTFEVCRTLDSKGRCEAGDSKR